MYLCYYNCILTKAQGQLIITPSISNLHKPILFKDSMFGVTGLPHWLWKYPHQTSLRPSKGIKGVVCCGLLSVPAQLSQGQARMRTKGKRHNERASSQGRGTDRLRLQGGGQRRGWGQEETSSWASIGVIQIHSFNISISKSLLSAM